jgi:hypothetical protein
MPNSTLHYTAGTGDRESETLIYAAAKEADNKKSKRRGYGEL